MNEMESRSGFAKASLWAVLFFFATSGLALSVVPPLLNFDTVKVQVDSFASDGSADPFTAQAFQQAVVRLRVTGAALLVASLITYIGRVRIQGLVVSQLGSLSDSFRSFREDLTRYLTSIVRDEDGVHLYALGLILILSIGVRLLFLFQPMRHDEAYTFIHFVSKPVYVALTDCHVPNNHIFHTLLAHVLFVLFGNQPWIIRLPALLAGILLVPASYLVIRAFYTKQAALLAAGIVASSSVFIVYSIQARGYTILCLIFLLILLVGKYLERRSNSIGWLLLILLSAIGFYTIPIMLYPFGIVMVWLFFSGFYQDMHQGAFLKNLFISGIATVFLTLLLYAPVLLISGSKAVVGNEYVVSKSGPSFVANLLPAIRSTWAFWNASVPTGVQILFAIGFFVSIVLHRRLTNYRVPIAIAVAAWCIPVLMIQRVNPQPRIWLFLLPLYAGLASAGLCYLIALVRPLADKYQTVAVALALALSLSLSLNAIHTRSPVDPLKDVEPAAVFLQGYLEPGDKVYAFLPVEAVLEYYFRYMGIPVEHLYADLNSGHRRVVIIVYEPRQALAGTLEEVVFPVAEYSDPRLLQQFGVVSLYEMVRKGETE